MSQRYAPGVRVEIRDAEWRIKCIDHTSVVILVGFTAICCHKVAF